MIETPPLGPTLAAGRIAESVISCSNTTQETGNEAAQQGINHVLMYDSKKR